MRKSKYDQSSLPVQDSKSIDSDDNISKIENRVDFETELVNLTNQIKDIKDVIQELKQIKAFVDASVLTFEESAQVLNAAVKTSDNIPDTISRAIIQAENTVVNVKLSDEDKSILTEYRNKLIEEEKSLFEKLAIAQYDQYKEQAGCHDVIYIDFSEMPRECHSYEEYIGRIQDGLVRDISEAYPEIAIDKNEAVWDVLSQVFDKTGHKFIFVMDEWDAVFQMSFVTERDRENYLLFLKLLLKGKSYVELAYMTGVLPIAKYSDGSELNMFLEYNMATRVRFSEYFGFTESEVDRLYQCYLEQTKKPQITRANLREWYDGYHTASGERLYNPRSVVCALTDNQLSNYWVSSGKYDSIFTYISHNVDEIQNDLTLMFAGEKIPTGIQEYAATAPELKTKEEIYSAMVVYGLLTYDNGKVFIPNKELLGSYAAMMKKEQSLGYIYRLANISSQMLQATLAKDTETMTKIIQYAHNTEVPILSYNNETELSAIVNLVYLSARDQYRVEREEKAGKGFVDFIFYPVRYDQDCIILELKVDHSPEDAIAQIKEKDYALRFRGKTAEKNKYTGRILAVGISYNKETKEHDCKVEEI